MKKIFSILFLSLVSVSSFAQRWSTVPSGDNTGRTLTFKNTAVTLASTDSITPNASHHYYTASIAGAKTVKIRAAAAQKWDKCTIEFTADATTRLVTFSSIGQAADINRDTISVMSSRKAIVEFIFDGSKWIHYNRYQQH